MKHTIIYKLLFTLWLLLGTGWVYGQATAEDIGSTGLKTNTKYIVEITDANGGIWYLTTQHRRGDAAALNASLSRDLLLPFNYVELELKEGSDEFTIKGMSRQGTELYLTPKGYFDSKNYLNGWTDLRFDKFGEFDNAGKKTYFTYDNTGKILSWKVSTDYIKEKVEESKNNDKDAILKSIEEKLKSLKDNKDLAFEWDGTSLEGNLSGLLLASCYCKGKKDEVESNWDETTQMPVEGRSTVRFIEVTEDLSIDFTHNEGKFYDISKKDGTNYGFIEEGNNTEIQQTHTTVRTVYLKEGLPKDIRPFTPDVCYEIEYSRWYQWGNEANTANRFPLKWGEGDNNTISTNVGYIRNSYAHTGSDDLNKNAKRDYPSLTLSDGFFQGTESNTIAVDFAMEQAGVKIDSEEKKVTYTEPTLAFRYLMKIENIEDFMAKIDKEYVEANRKYYEATAGMFFQVRLDHPAEDFLDNTENNYLKEFVIKANFRNTGTGNTEDVDQGIRIDNEKNTLVIEKPEQGIYTIELYQSDGGLRLAKYVVNFLPIEDAALLLEGDLEEDRFKHQSEKYLEDNANPMASIDFDDVKSVGTEKNVNYSLLPLSWDQSSFAYTYADYATYRIMQNSDIASHRTYLKDKGIIVYDRTYKANNSNPGYFAYVNACNEPGKLFNLKWDQDKLCLNSRIYVSGWINEFTANPETANLVFVFKGIKNNTKEEVVLHRFVTGYVPGWGVSKIEEYTRHHPVYTTENKVCRGEWMHVYYSFIPEIENMSLFESFRLEVENNTHNSKGADYALDEFRVYSSLARAYAKQDGGVCGNVNSYLVGVNFNDLIKAWGDGGTTPHEDGAEGDVYYAFFEDKEGFPRIEGIYNDNMCSHATFKWKYNDNPDASEVGINDHTSVCFEAGQNEDCLGVRVALPLEKFETDKSYYIVFDRSKENITGDLGKNPCVIFSKFTVAESPISIEMGSTESDDDNIYCIGDEVSLTIHTKDDTEAEVETDYDWFLGSKLEYDTYFVEEEEEKIGLTEILHRFRDLYSECEVINNKVVAVEDRFTQEMINLLKELVDKKLLSLKTKKVNITLAKNENKVVVVPIKTKGEGVNENKLICFNDSEFTIRANGAGPSLELGFKDIAYPDDWTSDKRRIRTGLQYIKKDNVTQTLYIPVYGPKIGETDASISNDGTDVYLFDTDDRNCQDRSVLGTVTDFTINPNSEEQQTIAIRFKTESFMPCEGYTYQLRLPIKQADAGITKADAPKSCANGDFYMTFCIVPEYEKWTGASTDNWNDDTHWVRSTKEELNKPVEDNYQDDEAHKGFVPMAFTYVTIPTEKPQVELYAPKGGDNTVIEGNSLLDLTMDADVGVTAPATQYIEYDIMADVKKEGSDKTNNVYCRQYYTNTVNEIHFEPNTEMLHTELLTYNKAWVDYDLAPNRWYTLASPLQAVVAGDWYVPCATYRQKTEYFKDILFDREDNKYNRFNPAVYQRSWDKGEVTRYENGVGDTKSTILANWSIVYNDVTVPYSPGNGFSIKTVADFTDDEMVLFRQPKADTKYKYYESVEDNTGSNEISLTNRDNTGKLNVSKSQQEQSFTLTNKDFDNPYFLVGNPFMAHLDMNKFFNKNNDVIDSKYWFVDGTNQTVAVKDAAVWDGTSRNMGLIAPLQSFFVKRSDKSGKSNANTLTVQFTNDMQALGTGEDDQLKSSTPSILLTARKGNRQSKALIVAKVKADDNYQSKEDAELFLDSNLSDVPTVYTVAGNQTTSINVRKDLSNIPFGIYSNDNSDVELTITGQEDFGNLELYDAETNSSRLIGNGEVTLTLKGNTHGRYFLRSDYVPTGNDVVKAKEAISIYSMMPGQVIVSSVDPLTRVQVYNLSGQLVTSRSGLNIPTTYIDGLAPGQIYIVKAETASQTQTEKVEVR